MMKTTADGAGRKGEPAVPEATPPFGRHAARCLTSWQSRKAQAEGMLTVQVPGRLDSP